MNIHYDVARDWSVEPDLELGGLNPRHCSVGGCSQRQLTVEANENVSRLTGQRQRRDLE